MFRNINAVADSATKANTVYVDTNSGFSPFDYNMLAKKVLASEEFQRLLINQLNISQSNLVKLHDQEFQHLFKNQLQEMNSENLNWINVNILHVYFLLCVKSYFIIFQNLCGKLYSKN